VEGKGILDSELDAEREKQYENTSKLEEMVSLLEYNFSLKKSLEKRAHDLKLNLDTTARRARKTRAEWISSNRSWMLQIENR